MFSNKTILLATGSWPLLTGLTAGIAQWPEHQPSKLRVAGSSPVSRSTRAHVAQLVEHILGKDEVHRFDPGRGLHIN
jgi:hypothetical protein